MTLNFQIVAGYAAKIVRNQRKIFWYMFHLPFMRRYIRRVQLLTDSLILMTGLAELLLLLQEKPGGLPPFVACIALVFDKMGIDRLFTLNCRLFSRGVPNENRVSQCRGKEGIKQEEQPKPSL